MQSQYVSLSMAMALLVLMAVPCIGSRREELKDRHPTDFLVSLLPGENPSRSSMDTEESSSSEEKALTDQLIARLASRGADPARPSVRYILDLYEKMERGDDIAQASGLRRRGGAGRSSLISGTDIIRGLAPTVPSNRRHRSDVTLSFPLSGLADGGVTELAELRIRPLERHPEASGGSRSNGRQSRPSPTRTAGGIQRVRVSIIDGRGGARVERIFRVRWRLDQEDNFNVLDVTRILRDMVADGVEKYQNGSLEISLRRTIRPRGRGRHARSIEAGRRRRVVVTENDAMLVIYSRSKPVFVDEEIRALHQAQVQNAAPTESDVSDANSEEGVTGTDKHRVRRRAGRRKSRCTMQDMYVDFETLGWADDIVFPARYNARTCSGRCPSPVSNSLHPTNHAILQSMMRMHDKRTPRPCCVPVALKPLMMLYKLPGGNIEIRHHPDMVVEQCGCR